MGSAAAKAAHLQSLILVESTVDGVERATAQLPLPVALHEASELDHRGDVPLPLFLRIELSGLTVAAGGELGEPCKICQVLALLLRCLLCGRAPFGACASADLGCIDELRLFEELMLRG